MAPTSTTLPPPPAWTLRVLSRLLAYPGDELRAHLPELAAVLQQENALSAASLAELHILLERLATRPALESEAEYVELFDRGRATSLHLFEHVHGDSRERGPAMIDLAQTYASSGLQLAPGELPDFLPAAVEFASTLPPRQARAFLAEMAHILARIDDALRQRQSAYAAILGALFELAGEKRPPASATAPAAAHNEPSLDAEWDEPPAFGGCASPGQGAPAQTIHFIRPSTSEGALR